MLARQPPGAGHRIVFWALLTAARFSLIFSPRPVALAVRRLFASGGAATAAGLARHAPPDVEETLDEPYGDGADARIDVFRPRDHPDPLPLVVWIHGGAWVGGSKDELVGYFKVLAHEGYVVASPEYSLAPEHRYPKPLVQVMQALDYLQANADRLGIDPKRIVLAGDSAGAQIASQVAALVTNPAYARAVGVRPTITPAQLRGVVLACGAYDLALSAQSSSALGRTFIHAVVWAYLGHRHYLDDPELVGWSVTDNVSPAFPPTFVSVGNADPLRAHSELLIERLRAQAVDIDVLTFPDDHTPPLGHEYQFNLDTADGQLFLERALAFLDRRLRGDAVVFSQEPGLVATEGS
jgi:acetyl esterase